MTYGAKVGSGDDQGRAKIELTGSNVEPSSSYNVTANFYVCSKLKCSDSSYVAYYDWDSVPNTSLSTKSISHTSTTAWSTKNETKIASKSKTFAKSETAVTKKVSFKFKNIKQAGGGATCSVVASFTIPALPYCTIKYNMNGGEGTIANQKKYYGKNLTLTKDVPIRDGYEFVGWSEDKDSYIANYSVGGTFKGNYTDTTITLYAVWKKKVTLTPHMNPIDGRFTEAFVGEHKISWDGHKVTLTTAFPIQSLQRVGTYGDQGSVPISDCSFEGNQLYIGEYDEDISPIIVEYTPTPINGEVIGSVPARCNLPYDIQQFDRQYGVYEFIGWDSNTDRKDGSAEYLPRTIPSPFSPTPITILDVDYTSDTELYAVYKRTTELAFEGYGQYNMTQTVYGNGVQGEFVIPDIPVDVPSGYQFDGWRYKVYPANVRYKAGDTVYVDNADILVPAFSKIATWNMDNKDSLWVKADGTWKEVDGCWTCKRETVYKTHTNTVELFISPRDELENNVEVQILSSDYPCEIRVDDERKYFTVTDNRIVDSENLWVREFRLKQKSGRDAGIDTLYIAPDYFEATLFEWDEYMLVQGGYFILSYSFVVDLEEFSWKMAEPKIKHLVGAGDHYNPETDRWEGENDELPPDGLTPEELYDWEIEHGHISEAREEFCREHQVWAKYGYCPICGTHVWG